MRSDPVQWCVQFWVLQTNFCIPLLRLRTYVKSIFSVRSILDSLRDLPALDSLVILYSLGQNDSSSTCFVYSSTDSRENNYFEQVHKWKQENMLKSWVLNCYQLTLVSAKHKISFTLYLYRTVQFCIEPWKSVE